MNLKQPGAVEVALELIKTADVMTEGLRPGVMERLGLGPDVVLAANPQIIYTRITGWGQTGPLAHVAGHDINYIALTGALNAIGPAGGQPTPPLNLVGDYGGGGMLAVFGILAALYERSKSGLGQVVDAAMVEGASLLMSIFHGTLATGGWNPERGSNLLDGGAPYYRTYETADGKFISVGSMEAKFYANLISGLGLSGEVDLRDQTKRELWPATSRLLAERFRTRTLAGWLAHFDGIDACLAPVLSMEQAYAHPQAVARSNFLPSSGSAMQPGPAPRFSRTANGSPRPVRKAGEDSEAVLSEIGFDAQRIAQLRASGAVPA